MFGLKIFLELSQKLFLAIENGVSYAKQSI
jgi:hypothetical protein